MDSGAIEAKGRISDSFLATQVPLLEGERVLTYGDYYLASRSWLWTAGTLYLTNRRIVWIKWKRWLNILVGYSRSRALITIRLRDVEVCRTGASFWSLWRKLLKVGAKTEDEIRFIPMHGTLDVTQWAEAINGLVEGARSADETG